MKLYKVRYVADGAWVDGPVVDESRVGPFINEKAATGVAGFQVDYVGESEAVPEIVTPA